MNWQQLKAILWLRWRLSQNQFVKAGSLSAAISTVAAVALGVLAVGFGIGGVAGGLAAGRLARPETVLLICDGGIGLFLFVWLIGVMTELQRAESIDISKLMHLPVTLKQIFVFNYAAAHFTPALILFAPLFAGFCLGLALSAGVRMALLVAVCLGFILMLTAWTYCLRGWLAALMANRRRAGAIAVWISIGFILIVQLPNLLMHQGRFGGKPGIRVTDKTFTKGRLTPAAIGAHMLLPPGWVGYSAMTLKQGSYWEALAAIVLCAAVAAAGIVQGERVTRRYYTAAVSGDAGGSSRRAASSGTSLRPSSALLVERSLPFLKNDVAGVALATFKSLARAPEMKLALLMPLVVAMVMGGQGFLKVRTAVNPNYVPFLITSGLILICFVIAPTMSNVFGLDRGGFRSFVLCPMPRTRILLGKNIAFVPVVILLSFLVLGLSALVLRAGFHVLLTGFLQAVAGFALFASVANYLAILAPYRYSMNSLKAKKFKWTTFVSALVSMMVAPVIGGLLMLPALLQFVWNYLGFPRWAPVDVGAGLALAALALWAYSALLPHQGRLLQVRELTVLQEVTTEME